jgi:tetratricopeptide (TPR) repeat protein
MLHLSAGRYRRAAALFRRVVRTGRLTDLSKTVEVFPEILADARIKLALCHRELGDVDRAMEQLELLQVKNLPPAVRRDLSEAKAFVYSLSRELMDETIDREIDRALEADPGNRRLLRLRRERAERMGDFETAIVAQKAVLRHAPASVQGEERKRLAVLHVRNALRLRRGDRDDEALTEAGRARVIDPDLPLPGLVAGDILADRGDARGAVREWARVPSLAGFERVRRLLLSGGLSGSEDLAFLVAELPRAGVLLLLAEHWLGKGKLRKAQNCLRKIEDLGAGDRHSARLLAEIRRREGDEEGARRLLWCALRGFLGAEPPVSGPQT